MAAVRLPAEFEPHRAVWLGWPANPSDWPGKFSAIPLVYAEMIRALCPDETVRLLIDGPRREAGARRLLGRAGVDLSRVEFVPAASNRNWTRDMLPFFVHGPSGLAAVRFAFSGWAKYPDHDLDAAASRLVARRFAPAPAEPLFAGRRAVLEGGAVDPNGAGDLLATEECLLDPINQTRNPGFTAADYEALMARTLGVSNVIWLGRGIAGDDTHGHVDDCCRFVSPTTAVLCREDDPSDPNHAALSENRERLAGARLADGSRLEVIDLPMPAPLFYRGQRLPASYANFFIGNRTVLAPTFNDPADRTALGILAECFPGRVVRGVHAVDLVWGLGAVHCLTHEEPLPEDRSGAA